MEEIWKDVIGFEGSYQVSNIGNVKSLTRYVKRKKLGNVTILKVTGRLLKQTTDRDGYKMVGLYKDTKGTTWKVHRLVAFHFVEGYVEGLQVNHMNGGKADNVYSNLEWVTAQQNITHAFETKIVKTKRVLMFSKENGYEGMFDSANTITALSGINVSHIQEICRYTPKRKHAGGYMWRYFDQLKLPAPMQA